jgi:D-beta-D-heptose 7-phosphate kinase/D-beta-D-heptose 1-phosphate adenosyltransferase
VRRRWSEAPTTSRATLPASAPAAEAADLIVKAIAAFERLEPYPVVDTSRPTSRKVRFVSEHYSSHLLRADWDLAETVPEAIEARPIRQVAAVIPQADAVVQSDYAEGVLTPPLISAP